MLAAHERISYGSMLFRTQVAANWRDAHGDGTKPYSETSRVRNLQRQLRNECILSPQSFERQGCLPSSAESSALCHTAIPKGTLPNVLNYVWDDQARQGAATLKGPIPNVGH